MEGETEVLKRDVRESWMGEHPSVSSWIQRLSKGTQRRYLDYAYRYFTWVEENGGEFKGKSPEELLDLQEKTLGRDRYKQVQLLQSWLLHQKGLRLGTKTLMRSVIRSFYAHNHVSLPRDVTFRLKGDKPSVDGSLTVEDLKKIVLSCNPLYQAVFLCMFQGAMGSSEFSYFNHHGWSQIEPQLHEGKRRLRVDIPGRKHKFMGAQNYFTFIGRDGVDALKRYLKERGSVKNGETIFLNEKGKPVSKEDIRKYWVRHASKVGVIKKYTPPCAKCGGETRRTRQKVNGKHKVFYLCNSCGEPTPADRYDLNSHGLRYGRNPHEMRDTFRSEWDLSQAKAVSAEFFMGHQIDPNMYNKIMRLHPEWAEAQYSLAEPYLNVMSEDPRKVKVQDIEAIVEQRVQERLKAQRIDLKQQIETIVKREAKRISEEFQSHVEREAQILSERFKERAPKEYFMAEDFMEKVHKIDVEQRDLIKKQEKFIKRLMARILELEKEANKSRR